jgi:hypothetical protein
MNITSVNQQLIVGTSERAASTVKSTQPKRKSDSVQISRAGEALSNIASSSGGSDSVKLSTDERSEERRVSSGGIESVMARYKDAQNFMAQMESGAINSAA